MRMVTEELKSKKLLLRGDGVNLQNCLIKEFSVRIVKFSKDLVFANMKAIHLCTALPL